ncbi:MAG: hypothetical protein JWO07_316 [Candidatus Saccharibacteria bacterium]|nr:hypothetical protein [Candidatus Saccharibacteria bacterium]
MADDDYTVQSYQDDLDDDNKPDPFMEEEAENPAVETFGIPNSEFRSELAKELDDDGSDGLVADDNVGDDEVGDDQLELVTRLDEKNFEDRGY